jgi:ribA/ribD-fused uncharacterized protein
MLTEKEEFELFWHGPFSQWHPCTFKVNGVEYCSAEQYMMAQKALLFGDTAVHADIMAEQDPKQIKKYGRLVSNFNKELWDKHRFTIVLGASIAKFTQNPDLKKILMDTELKTLVEASPLDNIWGIKLAADDYRATDRTKWKGINLLGQALTQTREYIKWTEYKG